MALTASEYRFLDFVTNDRSKKQMNKCITELRDLGTRKLLFEQTLKRMNNPGLKKKLIEIEKSIKQVNEKIGKLDRPPEEIYKVLKKDFRIDNIRIEDHTMIIKTKEVIIEQKDSGYLNYGKFRICLDFDNVSYDMESLDGKNHPMMQGSHIHVCSHESRLMEALDNGSFYSAALIMLSLLYQENLDLRGLSWL